MDIVQQLDDSAWCAALDKHDMLGLVESLPAHCRDAERIARSTPLPRWPVPAHVLVLGMGGSAIGGDLVRALTSAQADVPIAIQRDYVLPQYISGESLVIACSYSGNTEEVLAGYVEARRRGARMLAITSGGELARRASGDGYPVIRVPGGMPPRAALGYSFVPLLVILERLGILPSQAAAITEMVAVLEKQKERFGRNSELAHNPAKQLAAQLAGKAALVLGSAGEQGIAAYRWKCQINENSKALAFWNVFPELNHNETVGWAHPAAVAKAIHVVMLRDRTNAAHLAQRIDLTKELMVPHAGGISEIWAEGEGALARLFSLIYPGDFTSVYLAYLNGVDPTPIAAIDRLKAEMNRLANSGGN